MHRAPLPNPNVLDSFTFSMNKIKDRKRIKILKSLVCRRYYAYQCAASHATAEHPANGYSLYSCWRNEVAPILLSDAGGAGGRTNLCFQ